uniref:hypothetical protein n=1 Tax=Burkholderia arboris TaxID=488730 RepID=UPI003BEEE3F7
MNHTAITLLVVCVYLCLVIWRLACRLEMHLRSLDDPWQLPRILPAMVSRVKYHGDSNQLEMMRLVVRHALIELEHIAKGRKS